MNDKDYAEYLALLSYKAKVEAAIFCGDRGGGSDKGTIEHIKRAGKEFDRSMEDLEQ